MEANGLVKLTEECGELIQVAMKKIAFGEGDLHWDGLSLKERLEKEIADVLAASYFVIETFDLDVEKVNQRIREKRELFRYWHSGGTEIRVPEHLRGTFGV